MHAADAPLAPKTRKERDVYRTPGLKSGDLGHRRENWRALDFVEFDADAGEELVVSPGLQGADGAVEDGVVVEEAEPDVVADLPLAYAEDEVAFGGDIDSDGLFGVQEGWVGGKIEGNEDIFAGEFSEEGAGGKRRHSSRYSSRDLPTMRTWLEEAEFSGRV